MFQRADNNIVVVAWLRSSDDAEIKDNSGMLKGTRKETFSVGPMCANAKLLGTYDVEGHVQHTHFRVQGTSLANIDLREGQVFVAELACPSAK
jgi:hypothetical protein